MRDRWPHQTDDVIRFGREILIFRTGLPLAQCRKIELQQHWDEHEPDQDCHGNVDLGELGSADDVE